MKQGLYHQKIEPKKRQREPSPEPESPESQRPRMEEDHEESSDNMNESGDIHGIHYNS